MLLLPCPFCDYKADTNCIKTCIERMASNQDRNCFYVECFACGVRTIVYLTREKAIENWNKRGNVKCNPY